MDSGEHSPEPGNLMREDTSLAGATMTAAQCALMTQQGTENGWLQPVR